LKDEEEKSIIDFLNEINMKDVVYMTAAAWENILTQTLRRSWMELLSSEETGDSSTD